MFGHWEYLKMFPLLSFPFPSGCGPCVDNLQAGEIQLYTRGRAWLHEQATSLRGEQMWRPTYSLPARPAWSRSSDSLPEAPSREYRWRSYVPCVCTVSSYCPRITMWRTFFTSVFQGRTHSKDKQVIQALRMAIPFLCSQLTQ